MLVTLLAAANLALLGLAVGSLGMWGWGAEKMWQGEPLLDYRPRRPAPWGFVDIMIVLVVYLVFQVLARDGSIRYGGVPAAGGLEQMTEAQQAIAIAWSTGAGLLSAPAILLAVSLRSGATLADLGYDLSNVVEDLKLGGLAFVMLSLPVYGLQIIITKIIPYHHPVTDLVLNSEGFTFFAIACVAAVVQAPLLEELLFRVILQGWMESVAVKGTWVEAMIGPMVDIDTTVVLRQANGPVALEPPIEIPSSIMPTGSIPPVRDSQRPLAAEAIVYIGAVAEPDSNVPTARPPDAPPHWIIYITAALFMLAHWGQDAALISLFILGLGLGYLYQRTHRIGPSLVLHFLLNATSMTLLLIGILTKDLVEK